MKIANSTACEVISRYCRNDHGTLSGNWFYLGWLLGVWTASTQNAGPRKSSKPYLHVHGEMAAQHKGNPAARSPKRCDVSKHRSVKPGPGESLACSSPGSPFAGSRSTSASCRKTTSRFADTNLTAASNGFGCFGSFVCEPEETRCALPLLRKSQKGSSASPIGLLLFLRFSPGFLLESLRIRARLASCRTRPRSRSPRRVGVGRRRRSRPRPRRSRPRPRSLAREAEKGSKRQCGISQRALVREFILLYVCSMSTYV